MMNYDEYSTYVVRFYPDTPILCYPYTRFEMARTDILPGDPQHGETFLTGNMDYARSEALRADIEEHGIENPFVIEYRDGELKIHIGNNRACAMEALGIERGPALFVVPYSASHLLPRDRYAQFEIAPGLGTKVCALWREVIRARDDGTEQKLGHTKAWNESHILCELIRSVGDEV